MAKQEVSFGVAGSHCSLLPFLLPAGPGRPLRCQDPDAHIGHGPLGPPCTLIHRMGHKPSPQGWGDNGGCRGAHTVPAPVTSPGQTEAPTQTAEWWEL